VVTLAKGLGGGLPLGACIAYGDAAHLLTRGQHGSTFGGNPVACAAALAVLDTVERDGMLDRAGGLGARLRAGLSVQPGVAEVRGVGLLCGVRLVDPVARELEDELRQAGFLTNATSPDVLRLAPPLVVDESDLDAFVDAWPAAVARLPVGVP
jgi:acetylornithine aminotransferase